MPNPLHQRRLPKYLSTYPLEYTIQNIVIIREKTKKKKARSLRKLSLARETKDKHINAKQQ